MHKSPVCQRHAGDLWLLCLKKLAILVDYKNIIVFVKNIIYLPIDMAI